MHDFTRSTWTVDDTDRKRERLRLAADENLLRELEAAKTGIPRIIGDSC